jgi:hypothetical protein
MSQNERHDLLLFGPSFLLTSGSRTSGFCFELL